MHILFVLENYVPHIGGVEIVFQNLCERLAKKGHEVTVVTHWIPGTKRKEALHGVRILRVPCMDNRYLFSLAAIPLAVKQAKHADIIHTTTYNGAFPAWIAARARGKPAVMTVHETWMGKWRTYSNFSFIGAMIHELGERLIYWIPRFDRYICVSNSTRSLLAKALPGRKEKILTIHNGFDPTMWKRNRTKETTSLRKKLGLTKNFVILGTGRPGTSKGFGYLVDAFPKIKRKIPNAVLLLMLSTDTQYKHRIAELKALAVPGVRFLDSKPFSELPVYRQMADCIVVPSRTEGFGYVVLESASTGTPVVASNTTSIPEVIWGKHVLVRPQDSNAIAEGVVRVSKKKYDTTPEKSFPWDRNIAEHERLYKRLLQ